MKPEQDAQALSLTKRGKQSEQLTSGDKDEFEDLKKRGLNLRPLWRTIQRNVLLVTGVTTLVAAATLHSVRTSPLSYKGDFRLLVEPITSEGKLTDPSALSRDPGAYTKDIGVDYPSLLQILQSPGLLSAIAKQIQARYPDVSYESIINDLVVQRIGTNMLDSTKLIEVSYQGEDPEKVQLVLTELAKGYLKYSLDNRKIYINQGVKFIEDQLPGWQQRADNLQLQLQAFQQKYNLIAPEIEGAELSNQVRKITEQKLELQRELQEQRKLYITLQKQLALVPNEGLAASTLSENPNYQDLLGQLKKIESQIAIESARYREESPSIQRLRQQQKNLSLLLNKEAQSIIKQNVPSTAVNPQVLTFQSSTRLELIKQLVDTANKVQVLEVRNQALAKAEAFAKQQVKQFPNIIRQYNDLKGQLDIATKTLNQLLIQRETLRVEVAQKEVPWEIVSAPRIPRDGAGNPIPAPRDNAKRLAMGVIAGFVLGLGAAVLKDKYRNVFYSTEDIKEQIELPILGVISCNKSAKQFPNSSAFLEAFDSLYASIRFIASDPPVHSLVVSSAAPGDGKTTIALHLAEAAAAMGQRVLLVDANLRLPQIHSMLGLSNLQGLSNLLFQNLEPDALIQRSPLEENLFVLSAGQVEPNSTRLLASPQMQHLMEQFTTAFDLVIYDTPHLDGIADANFLADHTDGILMVVRVGKTKSSVLMQIMNELDTFRLPILGIVANHVEESTKKSRGYNNRYYEQNQRVSTNFEKTQKIFKTNLLPSLKATDDTIRY